MFDVERIFQFFFSIFVYFVEDNNVIINSNVTKKYYEYVLLKIVYTLPAFIGVNMTLSMTF